MGWEEGEDVWTAWKSVRGEGRPRQRSSRVLGESGDGMEKEWEEESFFNRKPSSKDKPRGVVSIYREGKFHLGTWAGLKMRHEL